MEFLVHERHIIIAARSSPGGLQTFFRTCVISHAMKQFSHDFLTILLITYLLFTTTLFGHHIYKLLSVLRAPDAMKDKLVATSVRAHSRIARDNFAFGHIITF
jgi:hypothetical protein